MTKMSVGTWFLTPIHFILNMQGKFKPCFLPGYFPVAVRRLHFGDHRAVGLGEGPEALVTPLKTY